MKEHLAKELGARYIDELDMTLTDSLAKAGADKINLCIQCGTCSASCPVGTRTALRTRQVIRRAQLGFRDEVFSNKGLWLCTTCSTCTQRCPRDVNPMEVLIGVRSLLVEGGNVPTTVRDALEGVFKYGNPWGISRSKRSEWAKDLRVKQVSEGEKAGLLYFVGCAASYDPRAQEVARALAKNLNVSGTDFSIMGEKESCCGNEIYALGEKGLFGILMEDNLSLFDRYGVTEIITTSPHCFNVFKNRYGSKDLAVQHYTQHLANLMDKGELKLSKKVEKKVTFQDPCYLGKHNNVYDEPRRVIENIPGVEFLELPMSRGRSVCCEGGGGRMWVDVPGQRATENRVKEAVSVGADILAVACPFCLLTFEDAIKTTGNESLIQAMDINELVAKAL